MDGFERRYFDVEHWEIVSIGDEYYRLLRASGVKESSAPLTQTDLDQLEDVYHYWKILMGCEHPRLSDMPDLLHCLHFDVIIELFCHRKLRQAQRIEWILND